MFWMEVKDQDHHTDELYTYPVSQFLGLSATEDAIYAYFKDTPAFEIYLNKNEFSYSKMLTILSEIRCVLSGRLIRAAFIEKTYISIIENKDDIDKINYCSDEISNDPINLNIIARAAVQDVEFRAEEEEEEEA